MVDLSQEPLPEKDGNKGALFSARLVREIRETLGRGRQVLLFLNRRGFASYPVCSKCGRPFVCENCSVTMTYHSGFGALVCHYCGSAQSMGACSKCGHGEPKLLGIGTERIQEEAAALFPEAKVARLDSDVTGGFRTVQATLRKLGRGEIDILVGTQMLAKGHDYPSIQLVGVVLADLSLNLPDFRAAERTFQLLTQVAGRSGRGGRSGQGDHPDLQPGALQSYSRSRSGLYIVRGTGAGVQAAALLSALFPADQPPPFRNPGPGRGAGRAKAGRSAPPGGRRPGPQGEPFCPGPGSGAPSSR